MKNEMMFQQPSLRLKHHFKRCRRYCKAAGAMLKYNQRS